MAEPATPNIVFLHGDAVLHVEDSSARGTSFGSGSGGGLFVDAETKNYLDAKVDAVKAQNDARFAEVRSGLDNVLAQISIISSKIDDKPSLAWLIGVGFAGVLAIVALLAFGGDRFDGGVQVQSSVSETAVRTSIIAEENARQITRILEILANDQPQESPPEGHD